MPSPCFAADPPELRRTVPLDGLTVIYHRPSGTTHVVASPVPELLDLLGEAPSDLSDLLARLEAAYELADDADVGVVLLVRLHELEASGLVFRV